MFLINLFGKKVGAHDPASSSKQLLGDLNSDGPPRSQQTSRSRLLVDDKKSRKLCLIMVIPCTVGQERS